jgi:predicted DNA-binding transcriptional regulator AlpA
MFPNPIPRGIAWPSVAVIDWMRSRMSAAGNDPAIIPDEPIAFWRLPEVIKRTGCSRSTIQRLVAAGQFPKPVTLRAIELEPIGG